MHNTASKFSDPSRQIPIDYTKRHPNPPQSPPLSVPFTVLDAFMNGHIENDN